MPWTGPSVVAHLTSYFHQFPGADIPDWLPISPWQQHLARHCRCKADHGSIRNLCLEWGRSKSAHYRRVKKSSQTVAESLNLEAACR